MEGLYNNKWKRRSEMLSMNEELFIAICGFVVVVLFALALYFLSREDKEDPEAKDKKESTFAERVESLTPRTGNSGGAEITPINFDHKLTWEFDPYKPRENFQAGYSASVTKKEKGKKTTWGCSICPEKTYQHATSAYKHLRNKHR